MDRIRAEADTLPSIEDLKQYLVAIDKEIDYLLNSPPNGRIICFISKVKPGRCDKCELCPLFVFDEKKKNSPHPCWHIQSFYGDDNSLWKWIQAKEEGLITELEYRAAFRVFMVPQFKAMRMLVEALIFNMEKAKEN